jgi:hypothetical protein
MVPTSLTMDASLGKMADQHRWYISVLRGLCAHYGLPHNWRALAGFRQQLRRIWFTCLRRRSQRSRRAGWAWFDAVTARSTSASNADHSFLGGATNMARVTFGKIRVRESRMLGSVRAKPNGLATRPSTDFLQATSVTEDKTAVLTPIATLPNVERTRVLRVRQPRDVPDG